MSSPDLIGGSHQIAVIAEIPSLRGFEKAEAISRNSRIPYRDPRVKPEDDIAISPKGAFLYPLSNSKIAKIPKNLL